ncbi:MAG: bifunctional diaminohydroxyphosphoribosylaminopyrimidine deaminase/5-amino-6-(5-phosphoribosylamino)uracil reductase RibD [Bacteroidales bacterium]|nr:bifunctional diaminohydroxyphosphoribosylaminopyrimidine deaminase/5-amino-6-(5-phosphoribosylamino)uracil reductase RibD [Bacteroidales bacterium]MCF8455259.1 bifunctional diaminohydroxyphosphoribosylaminopyrimidine deaminase/5-amino-6-(5-phosphoribosylamino)uracil reductase RibD [Bacteroidales bacterium]
MHETFMQRCLELASLGLGNTAPNPMVGCVIVHNTKIIGEGYHRLCGEAHAEVNAINAVQNKELLPFSTLYVNLEPCAHYGRTPPCSKLILEMKIPRVVIGCQDSYSEVSGKGIAMLRAGGVDVTTGILESKSRDLNKRFFTFHEKKRPYIILKWAQTLDGFIDLCREGDSNSKPAWITNEVSKSLVHKWRTEEDAILIGRLTAAKDNPQLNVREWSGKPPLRIALDQNLQLSKALYLFDNRQPTLVFNAKKNAVENKIEYVQVDFGPNFLNEIMAQLYEREIQSIIVEGGEIVLTSLIQQNLWDEIRQFIGNKMFHAGVNAPGITLRKPEFQSAVNPDGWSKNMKMKSVDFLGDARLFVYKNR